MPEKVNKLIPKEVRKELVNIVLYELEKRDEEIEYLKHSIEELKTEIQIIKEGANI